jgi:hypothetical protein
MSSTTFEDHEVLATELAFTGKVGVDAELGIGDEITLALRCTVTKIRHEAIKDIDAVVRVHSIKAELAAIVDDDLVADALRAQELRLETAAGVQRLPLTDAGF